MLKLKYYSGYYDRNCMQETSWGGVVDQHNNCVVGRYFQVTFNNIKKAGTVQLGVG